MSSGQMALTIGAFMLLGLVAMNFRGLVSDSDDVLDTNNTTQMTLVIGRSMIDEISRRSFDLATTSKTVVSLSDLTAPSGMGPASGEYYPAFNDVDDFNNSVFISPASGATPTASTPRCLWNTTGFRVSVKVYYVNLDTPSIKATTTTWAKRVDLTISNARSTDTTRLTYISTFCG
jgi:hypothetical protein